MFMIPDDKLRLDLQLFAESGTSVNTTTGTVNAYTGDATTTNAMSPGMKTFYDTTLLENAREQMVFTRFASHVPLPANHGKQIEFRKWNTFGHAEQLQEGVIPDAQAFGQTSIFADINQWGTFTAVSDILDLRHVDNVILGATEEMGASMAETQEFLLRDSLLTNPNVLYCDNLVIENGKITSDVTGATPTSCAELECSDTAMALLAPATLARAYTILRTNKVPFLTGSDGGNTGKYGLIAHPHVIHDLRRHPDWVSAHIYSKPEEIFDGQVGEMHGFVIFDSTHAHILKGEYVNKAGSATYASFAFGKDAYATIDPGEGNARMIVKDRKEIGGPLEQWSTIGYKFESGYIIKYTERLMRIMSTSSFSRTAQTNY